MTIATSNVLWTDSDGNEIDIGKYSEYQEYCNLCKTAETVPMSYGDWFDLQEYQRHLLISPNPLTAETFKRLNQVSKEYPTVQSLQDKVTQLEAQCDELATQRDRAIHFKNEAEKQLLKVQEELEELKNEYDQFVCEQTEPEELKIPSNQSLFPHYFKEVPKNTKFVDVYWVLKAWDVTDPCVQHAIKKLMAAGMRGAKNVEKDLQEARDSITRALELKETE